MEKLNVIVAMATKNDCYKTATPAKMGGIIVHSTAANNPYLRRYIDAPAEVGVNKYGNTWNNPVSVMGRSVAVHAFIGYDINNEIRVAQMLPYNIACWGNGSKTTGNCNYNPNARIQFEICEDNRQNKAYLDAVLNVATQYCAELCIQFGWDPLGMYNGAPVIMDHAESYQYRKGGNHSDIGHWIKPFGYTMDWFRSEVKRKMNLLNQKPVEPSKPVQPSGDFKIGDIVDFKGGPHYSSSQASAAPAVVKAGKAKITAIAAGSKHPYHLIGKDANAGSANSNVYGWVDANLVSKAGASKPDPTPSKDVIKVGSKVRVKSGAKTYTGGSLASFVYSTLYDVIEIKGDRVVIGIEKAVTAAVHMSDLTLVSGGGSSTPTTPTAPVTPKPSATIKVGSKVKVKSGAKTYTGGGLASFVYKNTYDVIQINGDRVVIGIGKAVTAAINIKDLTLA